MHFFPSTQGKPQTALQYLRRALQVDFQCLPALSHVAAVYHELGEVDAELQALALLYEVCLLPILLGRFLPSRACIELQAGFCLLGSHLTLERPTKWTTAIQPSAVGGKEPSEV